jgi:hypothetical protein
MVYSSQCLYIVQLRSPRASERACGPEGKEGPGKEKKKMREKKRDARAWVI